MWILLCLGLFVLACAIVSGISVSIGYILTFLISSIDMGSATVAGAIISVACIYFINMIINAAQRDVLERNDIDDFYDNDEEEEEEEIINATAVHEILPSLIKSDFFHSHSSNTNRTKSNKRRKRKK